MRLNEIMTYHELCDQFGESVPSGGKNRKLQMNRFKRQATIKKIDKRHYIIIDNEKDPELEKEENEKENKKIKNLLDFCEKRHLHLVEPPDKTLKYGDTIKYVCNFHPDIIQENTVSKLFQSVGCPLCKYPMSRTEVMIFLSIPNAIHRQKLNGVEFDITIPSEKILIEYNGYLYHNGEKDEEMRKHKLDIANKNGYTLININEVPDTVMRIEDNEIFIPTYAIYGKQKQQEILNLITEKIPCCNFTSDLWDKAAEYMRDWKKKSYNKEDRIIKQYDDNGVLIREYHGFKEIEEEILAGHAFGYNWKTE